MKAIETYVTGLLKREDTQYQIPLYQRPYAWSTAQCQNLWDDITEQASTLSEDVAAASHFLGAVVLAPAVDDQASFPKWTVVDGQQRLITLSLALAALRDHCAEADPGMAQRIENQYLVNTYQAADDRLRILPTQKDRETYRKVVFHREVPSDESRVASNYRYFRKKLAMPADDGEVYSPQVMEAAIATRLSLVDIKVDKSENPYRIFASLNNRGQKLSQADLVRNHIFMLLGEEGDRVHEQHWSKLDALSGDANTLEALMWLKLVLDGDRSARHNDLYLDQMKAFDAVEADAETAERYVIDLARLWNLYRLVIDPCAEEDPEVARRLRNLNEWNATASHPAVLVLLKARALGQISSQDVAEGLLLIESFLVRRMMIAKATGGLVRIFQSIPAQLAERGLPPVEGLHQLLSLPRRNWPNDRQFRIAMMTKNFYEMGGVAGQQRRFVLKRLEESYGHSEPVDFSTGKFTIEHVMPQKLSSEWEEALRLTATEDETPREMHQRLVHTIGNLTLTADNSKLSNNLFSRKKELFEQSHLEMNREIADAPTWNETAILERADRLADRAIALWPAPLRTED